MQLKHIVSSEDTTKTVKFILKTRLGLSERLVKKLKYAGLVFCDSIPVYVNHQVIEGNIISVDMDFNEINEAIIPEDIPIDIIYEDSCLLAVSKPPNMVVHPTWNHQTGTVANALMFHLLNKGIRTMVRPVSRLDRDTSGVIIFALNQFVQESLIKQMKSKVFEKKYMGIVTGHMKKSSGTISLPIGRKPDSIMLRHVSPEGVPSVTHYRVIERLKDADYVEFILETGRTHQIRVHCQASDHPLLGDTLYPHLSGQTPECCIIGRQALHSSSASFLHPEDNRPIKLISPIPSDITRALELLKV